MQCRSEERFIQDSNTSIWKKRKKVDGHTATVTSQVFLIGRVTQLDDTGGHNKWRKRTARPKNRYETKKKTRLLYSMFKWEYINSPKIRVRVEYATTGRTFVHKG
jgi:hypothetical protein